MRETWKKAAAIGFLAFLALWVAGAVRGLSLPYPQPSGWSFSAGDDSPNRLPQAHNLKQIGLEATPLPLMLDQPGVERIQVHEKRAQLSVGAADFDDHQALIRSFIAAHQAVVFNEKIGGIAPQRRLTLEIGVHPDKFEALVEQMRGVADLDSISILQRDRTGEFRRLHAQQQALKKHLEAILKLRSGAKLAIDDALKVEQKIQDIEKELHNLGVQFGEFLGRESYYHVFVTLFEYQPGSRLDRTYTLPRRLVSAFLWALAWWVVAAIGCAVIVGTGLSVWALWPARRG